MRNQKPNRMTILLVLCLTVVIAGGVYLAWLHQRDAQIALENQYYRSLKSGITIYTPSPAGNGASPGQPALPTPLPTPDADTIHIGLATAPPPNAEYALLLAANPDFCGWLRAGSDIDLPVVHRVNDNETYLTTNLEGEASDGGTLFVDGYNRLYPADTLTVIYGHNMNSGEMFGRLHRFESQDYLLAHPVVAFDTLYNSGEYVPFAAFYARTDEVDIRQFQPTVEAFNALVDQLQRLSLYDDGIDVRYGDSVLALVTCAGSDRARRFFLVCRRLREGETALDALMRMEAALDAE